MTQDEREVLIGILKDLRDLKAIQVEVITTVRMLNLVVHSEHSAETQTLISERIEKAWARMSTLLERKD